MSTIDKVETVNKAIHYIEFDGTKRSQWRQWEPKWLELAKQKEWLEAIQGQLDFDKLNRKSQKKVRNC